ncbi:hypothetical protein EDD27_3190 [Nonomuraea polychroma]|uniref:PH (Pleckstrin Homology) domain-containing protein n=1 Tax=Nonomuraea polychroma TaxID=46176 RepID=A0A438M4I4_9ACTN|nr:hypothetical protein [Nonomuraea polychroma]RVX40766.1 hypothetical protein EDD27_3190 [Nonomuraea polychroma]
MKLRGDWVVRLLHAFLGFFLLTCGLMLASAALDPGKEGLRLEHLVRASWDDLVAVAVLSVPLLAIGALIMARAPLLGVTCTETQVKVHKVLWSRRLPVERIIKVGRTSTGQVDLWWKGENGRTRRMRIPVLSVYPGSRTSRFEQLGVESVEPHNRKCVDRLRQWIDERRPG